MEEYYYVKNYIDLKKIPDHIKYIELGPKFNKKFDNKIIKNIPKQIIGIKFNFYFNQPIDNLPNNITHLTLKWYFNQRIDNLPNSITHLILGEEFNQPIDNLPNNIKFLKLRDQFNQPIDNLPNSITELEIGRKFNQRVDNLPNNLTSLYFFYGSDFNQPVDNLPNNLTRLTLRDKFNQPIDNLPNNLTYLKLDEDFNQQIYNLPLKLKKIDISFCIFMRNKYSRNFNILDVAPKCCNFIKVFRGGKDHYFNRLYKYEIKTKYYKYKFIDNEKVKYLYFSYKQLNNCCFLNLIDITKKNSNYTFDIKDDGYNHIEIEFEMFEIPINIRFLKICNYSPYIDVSKYVLKNIKDDLPCSIKLIELEESLTRHKDNEFYKFEDLEYL